MHVEETVHIKYNLNLWNKKANLTEQTIFSGAISKLKFIFLPFYIERVISIVPRVPACHRDTRRFSPVTIFTPEKRQTFTLVLIVGRNLLKGALWR